MRFEIEEDEYGNYFIIDTDNLDSVIKEFENKWDAKVLQELLNEVYNEGFEDGKKLYY